MEKKLQGITLILFGIMLLLISMHSPWIPIIGTDHTDLALWIGIILGIVGLVFVEKNANLPIYRADKTKAETSLKMFPPCLLFLFAFAYCLLPFPLGIFPLPFLTLEIGLNLREQDTGKGLHFMIGNPGAVVVDLLFPCHRSRPFSKAAPHRTDNPGMPEPG